MNRRGENRKGVLSSFSGNDENHDNQSAKRKGKGGSRLATNNEWDVGNREVGFLEKAVTYNILSMVRMTALRQRAASK